KQRKADLRLDDREAATENAVHPGDAANSPLVERVTSKEPSEVMPPPKSKKGTLTAEQIDVLKRWIDQGAKYDTHWAYAKPARPPVPEVANKTWVRNPIDAFIAAGHQKHGLTPSPEADRVTLIRRLSFDLTGLPPTPNEVDAFVNDKSPD